MKRIGVAILAVFFAAGLALAADYVVNKKAGPYAVEIRNDRNPPATGKNRMEIGIKDEKGQDVTDVTVGVEYVMPPMPGMAPMHYGTQASLKGGKYAADLNFSMAGPWEVRIRISRGAKVQSVRLNLDVH